MDVNEPCLLGIYKEFISSPRMDNQISCHTCIESFIDTHLEMGFLEQD